MKSPDAEAARAGDQRFPAFQPPWWLRNPHIQTLWPHLLRRPPRLELRTETLELADGDFLQLVWGESARGPVVILLHGLGGCAGSGYILGMLARLRRHGYQGVVMQFRGAAGVPNRLQRFFHAGETGDLQQTVEHVAKRLPGRPRAVVGFSMGGIITLNWLAEHGHGAAVTTAVTVSTPVQLEACALHLDQGLSRLYQWDIVRGLKRMLAAKAPPDMDQVRRIRRLWDFDDQFTAPLHGFGDARTYYRRCSPAARLGDIRIPTLMLQAADDPFIPARSLPAADAYPELVTMELHAHGGHVGFVTGTSPSRPRYWLEDRIMAQLALYPGLGPPVP